MYDESITPKIHKRTSYKQKKKVVRLHVYCTMYTSPVTIVLCGMQGFKVLSQELNAVSCPLVVAPAVKQRFILCFIFFAGVFPERVLIDHWAVSVLPLAPGLPMDFVLQTLMHVI